MITILEAIKLSTEYLEKKNVESPRINSEILLSEILKCKRLDLYLSFDKPLSETELNLYREFIKKRGMRIPLQYIIGYVEFYGLRINVNKNVLIPRPETELLVEKIIEESKKKNINRVLDIGSGSGNIALAIAKNIPQASVVGADISRDAIKVAQKNALDNLITNVEFLNLDILNDDLQIIDKFDLVVSNPPYVSLNDFNNLEPELKDYEPRIALTDESDGLTFYKRIITLSKSILNNGGKILFEIGKGQHNQISNLLLENDFINVITFKDYHGIERIICGEIK
jgi:release factor glutamine methyltransferase